MMKLDDALIVVLFLAIMLLVTGCTASAVVSLVGGAHSQYKFMELEDRVQALEDELLDLGKKDDDPH